MDLTARIVLVYRKLSMARTCPVHLLDSFLHFRIMEYMSSKQSYKGLPGRAGLDLLLTRFRGGFACV